MLQLFEKAIIVDAQGNIGRVSMSIMLWRMDSSVFSLAWIMPCTKITTYKLNDLRKVVGLHQTTQNCIDSLHLLTYLLSIQYMLTNFTFSWKCIITNHTCLILFLFYFMYP